MTKKTLILSGFILTKFVLQYFLINSDYDLHRDEYLHLDQANHLAWGYLSLPPATSWLSYIIRILGNSLFWIKFFPALFGALTLFIVWKTIEVLKGNLYAHILGATCVLLSVLLRLNFLFQPNSLDVLCWTALCFSLIKYFNEEEQKWLYFAAIIFAIGFLNKYNIVFLLIGLVPALLLTAQRKIFLQKGLYLSIVFALIMISPNLYWQYTNDFPVFHHLKELAETQLVHVNRWLFLREQLFYFIGALPVIIGSLYALLFYEPFKKYKFLFWSIIFTLFTFTYLKAKGYYAIGIYPVYIAFGSVYLSNILDTRWEKFVKPIILALPLLCYVLLFTVFYKIESPPELIKNKHVYQKLGLLRWEDGKDHVLPQDLADMLGWKELANKVENTYNKLPKETQTFILCDNYGQAAAINFYAKNETIKAVSFNADYINWFPLDKQIDNFIRVKEFDGSNDEFSKTSPFFKKSFIADCVNNTFAREYRTSIFVFIEAKVDVNQRLQSEIAKAKKGY